MDTPKKFVTEIIRLLLIVGADGSIECNENKIAVMIAQESGNTEALVAFEEFEKSKLEPVLNDEDRSMAARRKEEEVFAKRYGDSRSNKPTAVAPTTITSKYVQMLNELRDKYSYQEKARVRLSAQSPLVPWESGFSLPPFLFDHMRTGLLPICKGVGKDGNGEEQMRIHEQQILPLAEEGFFDLEGVEAIRCLSFAREQALLNKDRRARLVAESDPLWVSPKVVQDSLQLNKF
jgi:hypothetical protein